MTRTKRLIIVRFSNFNSFLSKHFTLKGLPSKPFIPKLKVSYKVQLNVWKLRNRLRAVKVIGRCNYKTTCSFLKNSSK